MQTPSQPKIGVLTASSIVVANMIGTGVFTSLGFQVADIQSVFSLMMLWILGGVIAFCGALAYGELGTALPRSGGEYHLLSRVYHPAMGFLSGWVSATVGFAAPTAIAAVAMGKYTAMVFPSVPVEHLAAAVVIFFAIIHATSISVGSFFQVFFTVIKVGFTFFFIAIGFFTPAPQVLDLLPAAGEWQILTSAPFAVALVYVSYAYTGWNAAIYVVGELKAPSKNLPIALLASTLVVMVLYVLVNYVFLYAVPMDELAGKVEIGFLAGEYIFGATAANFISIMIAVLLLSTISALVFVGARITQIMGEDYRIFRLLAQKTKQGTPLISIAFQTLMTLIFIYTSTFEQVMVYAGFTLAFLTTATVAGVYVMRIKAPDMPRPYKTWGYPYTPAIFLFANAWIMWYVLWDKPFESLVGISILVSGLVIYLLNRRISKNDGQMGTGEG